jgi:hypothetical protein
MHRAAALLAVISPRVINIFPFIIAFDCNFARNILAVEFFVA